MSFYCKAVPVIRGSLFLLNEEFSVVVEPLGKRLSYDLSVIPLNSKENYSQFRETVVHRILRTDRLCFSRVFCRDSIRPCLCTLTRLGQFFVTSHRNNKLFLYFKLQSEKNVRFF